MTPDVGPRGSLTTPRLVGLIAAFWFVPQVVALFVVPGIADGPSYSSVRSALQLEIIPDLGGAIIAAWAVLRLGWTDLVRREPMATRRWVVAVPVALVVASVAAVDYPNLADAGAALVAALVVGTFWTGVSEELMFRGVTLQAMRDRHRERVAAVLSSLLFGALHLTNAVVAGPAAAVQALWAFGMGYLLYLCRRVGRGLVLPIAVHWSWDLSTFSSQLGRDGEVLLGDAAFAQLLASVVLIGLVAVRHRSIPSSPAASSDLDPR